jgi:hypothetical protein
MPAGDERWAALWSAVSVVLAGVLAVVAGLAVGAVPASWGWAHHGGVVWGAVGGLVVASAVTARSSNEYLCGLVRSRAADTLIGRCAVNR